MKAKLIKKLTDDRYKEEIDRLEKQLKKYKPGPDPEDAELHDLSTFASSYVDI